MVGEEMKRFKGTECCQANIDILHVGLLCSKCQRLVTWTGELKHKLGRVVE